MIYRFLEKIPLLKNIVSMKPKTEQELVIMRESCVLLSKALGEVAKRIRPGTTGIALDEFAYEYISDHKGKPAFKGFHGFPYSLCISVNDAVVHGFPTTKEYQEGDIVSVDCGILLNGYYSDMAYTFALGEVSEPTLQMMRVTKASLYAGIEKAITNNRIGDISNAIQMMCEKDNPYALVRELVGHGIGKGLHEEPQVPNVGRRGDGKKLLTNITIAIEPMVNLGTREIYTMDDKWTIATEDGEPSAHFEHTLCVKPNAPEILTTFDFIEEGIRGNKELTFV